MQGGFDGFLYSLVLTHDTSIREQADCEWGLIVVNVKDIFIFHLLLL